MSKHNQHYSTQSCISSFTLRHQFLSNEHIRVKKCVEAEIQNSDAGICRISDGWSGILKRHVLNVLLTTLTPFLVNTIYTEDQEATAEYQASKLESVKLMKKSPPMPHELDLAS